MIRKLEAAFAGWPSTRDDRCPPVPSGDRARRARPLPHPEGREPGPRVRSACPRCKRDSPDIYALEVMNEILGGSGFTSRITKTVRSNEGLAYSAGSGLSFGVVLPRAASARSSSRRAARCPTPRSWCWRRSRRSARRRSPPRSCDTIKNNLIETFPSNFASKAQADGHLRRRRVHEARPAFWATYRDRIQAVTAADVQRVARTHLVPGEDDHARGGRPEGDRPRRRQARREARGARPRGQGRRRCRCRDPMTMKRAP